MRAFKPIQADRHQELDADADLATAERATSHRCH